MAGRTAGFALFEVVLGLVVLGIAGAAIGRGVVGATRAMTEGRRWTDAALLARSVVSELEAAYRASAPGCVAPPGGARSGRGVLASWWVIDGGDAIDLAVALRVGPRTGSVDTVRARVTCR